MKIRLKSFHCLGAADGKEEFKCLGLHSAAPSRKIQDGSRRRLQLLRGMGTRERKVPGRSERYSKQRGEMGLMET